MPVNLPANLDAGALYDENSAIWPKFKAYSTKTALEARRTWLDKRLSVCKRLKTPTYHRWCNERWLLCAYELVKWGTTPTGGGTSMLISVMNKMILTSLETMANDKQPVSRDAVELLMPYVRAILVHATPRTPFIPEWVHREDLPLKAPE